MLRGERWYVSCKLICPEFDRRVHCRFPITLLTYTSYMSDAVQALAYCQPRLRWRERHNERLAAHTADVHLLARPGLPQFQQTMLASHGDFLSLYWYTATKLAACGLDVQPAGTVRTPIAN